MTVMEHMAYVIYLGYDKPCPAVGPFSTREEALTWVEQHGHARDRENFEFRVYALGDPATA